jgi:hypothetical protein
VPELIVISSSDSESSSDKSIITGADIVDSLLGKILYANLMQKQVQSKQQIDSIKNETETILLDPGGSHQFNEMKQSVCAPNGTNFDGKLYFCAKKGLAGSDFIKRVKANLVIVIQEGEGKCMRL